MKKSNINKDLRMSFWTIISALIYSYGLVSFSIPAKLYPGGFSGLSRILSDLGTDFLNLPSTFSILYIALNAIVSILVFKYIGKRFCLYSLLQVCLVAILTQFLKPIIIVDDILLYSVFGGILCGFGSGIALANNLSGGGLDFIAIFFSNKYNRSTWNYILVFNVVVVMVAGIIYGWEIALYSIILQFCNTQVVKRMHKRFTHQTITVITEKKDEVIESILSVTRHGITELEAKGAYLKKNENYLYMVVNAYETNNICHAILNSDPHAFINIQDSKGIYGNFYQKPFD